ncbi:unnamed protein product [Acidithrix sp. C25]|nr:unnamed protein product [Acidithrix sp. C25]
MVDRLYPHELSEFTHPFFYDFPRGAFGTFVVSTFYKYFIL